MKSRTLCSGLVTRLLGPEGRGLLAAANTVMAVGIEFSTFA